MSMRELLMLPNLISISRLPLAILTITYIESWFAVIFFVLAAIADVMDGWVARRLNQTSQLGAILDPFMDKVVNTMLFGFLIHHNDYPLYWIPLFFSRDILVILGFIIFYSRINNVETKARGIGKMTTGLQFFCIITMIALPSLSSYLIGLLTLTSIFAVKDYVTHYEIFTKKDKNGKVGGLF